MSLESLSKMIDMYCPVCEAEFEAEMWSNGQCACGNCYYFSESYFEDEDGYSDCYLSIDWDRYE